MNLISILYTDGGARPNPGKIGSGVHGYTFDKDSNETVTFVNNFTEIGYRTNDEMNVETPPRRVKPVQLHDYSFSHKDIGTNNYAEISAIILGITEVLGNDFTRDCKKFVIFTDSMTSIRVFTGIMDDYQRFCKRSSLKPNVLQAVKTFVDWVKEKGVVFKLNHIKAHSIHYGNQLADVYATMALMTGKTTIINSDMKGYLNPPKGDNPLVKAKYVYFDTHEHKPGIYRIITIKEEGWMGRVDPETNSYGMYFGKPVPAIDDVIEKLSSVVPQVFSSVVNIPNLFNPKNNRIRSLFKDDAYMRIGTQTIGIGEGANKKDNTNIVANVIQPSALTKETKHQFRLCEMAEYNFKDRLVFDYIDITDLIYTDTKKNGNPTPHEGFKKLVFKFKTNVKDDIKRFDTKFHLYVGVELPTLIQINKSTKKKPAKIYLCILWTGIKCDYVTMMTYGDEEKLVVTNASCSIFKK